VIDRVERGLAKRVSFVAETAGDARDVMIEGESGLMACSPPWFRPKYEPSKRRISWPNGAIGTTFSADDPDQLRGPQSDCAWADELAKWQYEEAWDNLVFGLRLGDDPRACITTTPRPTKLIKSLVADPLCRVVRGSTDENRANLAAPFLDAILKKYRGTRLGRQELDAEILDDAPGALWKRDEIEKHRRSKLTVELVRIVIAIDPSVASDSPGAETGIVAVGLGTDGEGYLLADGSIERPTPEQWGSKAVQLYTEWEADRIIAEVNNGGDLVESNIRAVNRNVPVKKVRASRGKLARAEPCGALGEQGRLHHVGTFPLLEDQLCQWEPGVSLWSPNRLDAYVWAITELMLGGQEGGSLIIINPDDD
jgi:phage terminase large subunit-like protein